SWSSDGSLSREVASAASSGAGGTAAADSRPASGPGPTCPFPCLGDQKLPSVAVANPHLSQPSKDQASHSAHASMKARKIQIDTESTQTCGSTPAERSR